MMTTDEMRNDLPRLLKLAGLYACKAGSLHPIWDTISLAERVLSKENINWMTRGEVVRVDPFWHPFASEEEAIRVCYDNFKPYDVSD